VPEAGGLEGGIGAVDVEVAADRAADVGVGATGAGGFVGLGRGPALRRGVVSAVAGTTVAAVVVVIIAAADEGKAGRTESRGAAR
jgi:hypothetical protein